MVAKEIQLLKNFEEDGLWLSENRDRIQDDYANKFVAVKGKKIIASGANFEKVLEEVEKTGENPSFVLVRFIFEKGYTLII